MSSLPRRRTPVKALPSTAWSGGSKVFSALMPGARLDSIRSPGKHLAQSPGDDLHLGQLGHASTLDRPGAGAARSGPGAAGVR